MLILGEISSAPSHISQIIVLSLKVTRAAQVMQNSRHYRYLHPMEFRWLLNSPESPASAEGSCPDPEMYCSGSPGSPPARERVIPIADDMCRPDWGWRSYCAHRTHSLASLNNSRMSNHLWPFAARYLKQSAT